MNAPKPHGETQSARRDAWRTQLFHEQIAEEAAQRRRAQAMRSAVIVGVVLGLVASVAMYV